jgi:hypothetical protein
MLTPAKRSSSSRTRRSSPSLNTRDGRARRQAALFAQLNGRAQTLILRVMARIAQAQAPSA